MTIEEQICIFEHNAEHERKGGDLNNCLHFRQLAEWLKDYKRLLGQEDCGVWIEHIHNGMHYIECPECSSWFLKMHLPQNSYCPICGVHNK